MDPTPERPKFAIIGFVAGVITVVLVVFALRC